MHKNGSLKEPVVRLGISKSLQLRKELKALNEGELRKMRVTATLVESDEGYYVKCVTKRQEGFFPETRRGTTDVIGPALSKHKNIYGASTTLSGDGKTLRIAFKVW